MPKLKVDHVETFSSEDPVHVANNLLSSDPSKKWKCQNPGEKSTIAVLKLEKPSVISGIDIGNENSAYVEVLVTRSGSPDDYKVLLVMSSFMTPLEARQTINTNKVRMFTAENLSKPECEQKWDKIKIVCTQPFNRHVQYGLSFVTLYTPGDKSEKTQSQTKIGQFNVRPSSPDTFSAANLFARAKEEKQESLSSVAFSARKGHSLSASEGSPSHSLTSKLKEDRTSTNKTNGSGGSRSPKSRNRDDILYDKADEDNHDRTNKINETINKKKKQDTSIGEKSSDKKEKAVSKKEEDKQKPKSEKKKSDSSLDTSNSKRSKRESSASTSKRKNSDDHPSTSKKCKTNRQTKPFSKLLEGVTLVISGIQNPHRSNLRNMAMSMGAKYKADWDSTCTHLICAFPNTPKFKQVQGKGKIVTSKWLEECHSQRKRLPWRRYCLDKNDKGQESEEEISEQVEDDLIKSDVDTDVEDVQSDDMDHTEVMSDTEERIQKILTSQKVQTKKQMNDDVFSIDTEPEDDKIVTEKKTEPSFKNLFADKAFFIDTKFDKELYKRVNKYIVAYNGGVVDDPTDEFDLCITDEENSEEIKLIHPDVTCVKPDWVWEVHNKQMLVPYDDYVC